MHISSTICLRGKMQARGLGRFLFLLWGVLALSAPTRAVADDCMALGGMIVSAECQISAPQIKSNANCAGGVSCTLDETLHILGAGSITVAPVAAGLSLTILGDLIIDTPSGVGDSGIFGDVSTTSGVGATVSITAEQIVLHGDGIRGARLSATQQSGSCTNGKGGLITLVAHGDVTTEPGSVISTNATCSAGEISISADMGVVSIGGLVSSQSSLTGTGPKQRPGGGPISIQAGCDLVVTDTGVISSKGKDPGADLVHLEGGCDVMIFGLVESTGPGHAVPKNPTNRCSNAHRPDKPLNATACIEVWAGKTLTIDSTTPHNGEVNADTAQAGGSQIAWVDLFATDALSIIGEDTGPFAVHANAFVHTPNGGLITAKSVTGGVSASKRAVQADATAAGGKGGKITLEAMADVILDSALLFSRGNIKGAGARSAGGSISARSFAGSLSWRNGVGDVKATGLDIPAPRRGVVALQHCLGGIVDTSGSVFPANGAPTTPTMLANDCSGSPTLPLYVLLPTCACMPPPPLPEIVIEPEGCTFCDLAGPDTEIKINGQICNSGMTTLDNVMATNEHCGDLVMPPVFLNLGECIPFDQTCTVPDATFIGQMTMVNASGESGMAMATDQETVSCTFISCGGDPE